MPNRFSKTTISIVSGEADTMLTTMNVDVGKEIQKMVDSGEYSPSLTATKVDAFKMGAAYAANMFEDMIREEWGLPLEVEVDWL